jgi:hypothetical protein
MWQTLEKTAENIATGVSPVRLAAHESCDNVFYQTIRASICFEQQYKSQFCVQQCVSGILPDYSLELVLPKSSCANEGEKIAVVYRTTGYCAIRKHNRWSPRLA